MEKSYKLSSVLHGHTGDVRAVTAFADGTIVSVSRDMTARVWKPIGRGNEYEESAILRDHSKYVSAVCVINPSEKNPKGYIVTGSHDKTICVYVADETSPTHVITTHRDTVCKLSTGKKEGTFLSSSWDHSARLWDVNDPSEPQLTLVGHTSAVWCVADLSNGNIVTGSADKLVIVWTRNGSIQHKLTGHTDCVRDIVDIKEDEFLTCANDATIRHWDARLGTCLGTYSGHKNYIYSIAAVPNGTYVYSSGEDRTVGIWYNMELSQTIVMPTHSIWCINLFLNGDIVVGCSDGVVRIFSSDPERHANAEVLQAFDKAVASFGLCTQQVGSIATKDLSDSSVLLQPGQRDGQQKIVNEGNVVGVYNWSQSEQRWIKIGNVVDSSGALVPGDTAASICSSKQLYNGTEYDYVFSVDIQDGVPPLKLPYNKGQDPWHVAQKFLHDNNLSQLFLDQVANFIIKNAEPAPIQTTGSQYVDPFTGGSRYVPGTSSSTPDVTGDVQSPSLNSSNVSSSCIPHLKYLMLDRANKVNIFEKLRQLNAKQENIYKVPDENLDLIEKLTDPRLSKDMKTNALNTLKGLLLDWPNDIVFPVLDMIRLAVLFKEMNDQLCTEELLPVIRRHLASDAIPSNQMLTFRLIANMFHHEKGEKLCLDYKDEILKFVLDLQSLGNKSNQVAISTYILNLIVALNKFNDAPGKTRVLNVLLAILPRLNEAEAIFRALVGLGTLLTATSDPNDRSELIVAVRQSETALNVLKTLSENRIDRNTMELLSCDKVAKCSKQIIDLII